MDITQEMENKNKLGTTIPSEEALLQQIERLQATLLEQEKLASIGQLTAGILHEIKNPLNFIINFSRISLQLIEELSENLSQLNNIDAELQENLADIHSSLNGNITKISENGNRAQRIILNMLNQSRDQTAESFVKTDINQLVDEFVKLAYQSMRGQNKDFNITIKSNYDPTLGEVNIIPQDFSRVIINLVNNACYALEKRKTTAGAEFSPILEVQTKKSEKEFTVCIKDNGLGITPENLKKIFNPFFTTKPTGEGTGLGLYLSYDIIVKRHKGKMEVDSKPNEFTQFLLTVPLA
jgi:two-component system, NtrC family, sensor kinase